MSRREECAIETRKKGSLGLASKYKGYTGFLCVFNSYNLEIEADGKVIAILYL